MLKLLRYCLVFSLLISCHKDKTLRQPPSIYVKYANADKELAIEHIDAEWDCKTGNGTIRGEGIDHEIISINLEGIKIRGQ
jgi:hypothetical protein